MLQDLLKHVWAPLGRVSWYPAVVFSSALFVAMWGHFLYQGITDPLGGINSLWPLFGISNQLLASVALCVGTTVIIKMGKARYAPITLLPLAWLVVVTGTAGCLKIFSSDPALGFLAHARRMDAAIASGAAVPGFANAAAVARAAFNDRLDAVVAAVFLLSVVVILWESIREWIRVLQGTSQRASTEIPYRPSRTLGTQGAVAPAGAD